jgi:hypothetical protein
LTPKWIIDALLNSALRTLRHVLALAPIVCDCQVWSELRSHGRHRAG